MLILALMLEALILAIIGGGGSECSVYLHKDLYDEVIDQHLDVNDFVNKTVAEALKSLKEEKQREEPRMYRGLKRAEVYESSQSQQKEISK